MLIPQAFVANTSYIMFMAEAKGKIDKNLFLYSKTATCRSICNTNKAPAVCAE